MMEHGNRKKTWSRLMAILVMLAFVLTSLSSNGMFLSHSLASEGSNFYDQLIEEVEQQEEQGTPTPLQTASEAITEAPDATESLEISISPTAESEATPKPVPVTPTHQPASEASAIHGQIAKSGFAYETTTDGQTGVFSGRSLSSASRIGTLNGKGQLLFATEYVEREGKSAAMLVWFDTDNGIVSGYVSEDRLGQETMDRSAAETYIDTNGLDTCDYDYHGAQYLLAKADYERVTEEPDSEMATPAVSPAVQPTPAPNQGGFIPLKPVNPPTYYFAIGTAEFDISAMPTDDAFGDAGGTQGPNVLGRPAQFFRVNILSEEESTSTTDIYTFIGSDGVQYYRVYGSVDGVEGYYACDENGTLLVPYELIDIVAEQEELASGTPSISTRGLMNFSLTPAATPPTVPSYYSSFPAGENTTVYTFVGRDGATYYRIYGTNTSGDTGFFACDQYGENEGASPLDMANEYNTIAPYAYVSLAAPSMPTGLTKVSSSPFLYSYLGADGSTQYRMYGVKLNDPTDTDKHWYATDNTGTVIKQLIDDDIQLDMNNLWVDGFIEAENAAAATAPSFYGLVGGIDNTDTIKARQTMWAYTDREGVVRYRVYGTVKGVVGFYESDADGNALSLTPVDLANEQLYLSPLKNGIADDYIPGYAKVISTNVTAITDGTPVWDATTSAISTGTLGNDSSPSNKVVRSFDQIAYELDYVTELNTSLPDGTDISNYKGFNNAKAYIRFEVPITLENDVSFIMSDMSWLKDGKATYDAVNHKWVLTGYREIASDAGNIALPNRGTLNVIMRVNGAANAQTITPTASVWLDQGKDSEGNDLNATYTPNASENTTGFQAVRVTAAPKYNVGVRYAEWNSVLRAPNFTTGDLDTGAQNYWVDTLAFVTEIRNDTPEKGLKGIEFPKGNFSFDLTVESGLAGYDVSLWDYYENDVVNNSNATVGILGRTVMKGSYAYSPTDSEGLSASTRNTTRSVYDGGSFTVTEQTISATKKVLHVTVKDYRIDGLFPTKAGEDTFGVTYGTNEGVFSVGNIEILIKANPVATTTTVPMTATISNLSATSTSGVATTTDVYSPDNTTAPSFTLYPPGNLSKAIFMVSESTPTAPSYNEAYSKMRRGEYSRALASAYTGFLTDPAVKVGALDIFTKLDAEGYTVTRAATGLYADHVRVFYGALPSGGNWTSDLQMEDTRQEALDWYTSLSDLGSKKCVGVLFEYRGEGTFLPSSIVNVWNNTMGYVPETATVNKVYQAVNDLKYWTNSTAAAMTADVNTIMNNKGAANPPPAGAQFTNSTAISGVSTNPYAKRTYNMTTYETTGGHTGGYNWGTSWLVIADFVQISKTTAQSADKTVGGAAKSIYSLNDGERRVDYAITPTYTTGGVAPGTINGTVTITDTLPNYLTYVPGSSYQGGTYVQGSDSQNSYHTGGTALPPTVTVNSTTGVTTLVWTITTMATAHSDPMEKIYFSAVIGDENDPAKDPTNNTGLNNSVSIAASTAVYPASASKAITVTNLADMTLTKSAVQEKVELGEDVQYDMVLKNNSTVAQANLRVLDIMPYNGDGRGTDYDGSNQVTQIVVQQTSAANTNLTLMTTTDPAVRTRNARSADLLTGVTWTTPTPVVSSDGKTKTYTLNSSITGFALVSPSFEAQSRAKVTVNLKPTSNAPGDVYANSATMDGTNFSGMITAPVVSTTVVQRSISGLAWIDINKNGRQDASELKLAGLEAQLYRITRDSGGNITATTRVTSDIKGTPFGTVLTDANGEYSFENLPAGEYQVRMDGTGDLSIDTWKVTTLQASGVSESSNSNGIGNYNGNTLDYATIDAISLPEKEALSISVYTGRYYDVGFYSPLSFTKEVFPASGTSVRAGDILTYSIKVEYPVAGVDKSYVSDKIPDGTMFVPGSIQYKLGMQTGFTRVTDAAYSYQSNTITFPLLKLEQGTNEFVFQVVVDKTDEIDGEKNIDNIATLTAPDGSKIESNETTNTLISRYATIEKTAALVNTDDSLAANDSGTATTPVDTKTGQQVEYVLTVTAGGSDQLTSGDIVVTDPLPAGTTQVSGSFKAAMLSSATGSTAAGLNTGAFVDVTGGKAAQWTLSGLKTGDVVELRFRVTAPTAVDPTTHVALFENQATLHDVELSLQTVDATAVRITRDADGNPISTERITQSTPIYTESEVTKESETTYHVVSGIPLITAVKSALPVGASALTPVVKAGDTITYSIDVKNEGDGNGYDVLAYDSIPTGTTYVTNSATIGGVSGGTYNAVSDAIGWRIPQIDPGQTVRLSFQVTVDAPDTGLLIRNVARYTDPDDPLNPGNPEDWTPTDPVDYQTVSFSKTANPAGGTTSANATTVKVGDVIAYTLTLKAGAELRNVIVSDQLPDGVRLVSDSIGYLLANGETKKLADTYLSGGVIRWPSFAAIPAGINVFTFSAVVERLDGLYTAAYDNYGTVKYDDNIVPGSTITTDSDHVTHKASVSMPEIHKTAALVVNGTADVYARGDEANPIQAIPDQQVEYIITVTGHGDDSDEIVVTDPVPSGATYVSSFGIQVNFSNPGNGSVTAQQAPSGTNGQTLSVTINHLSDGQTATIRYRVTAPELTSGVDERFFNNTATLYNPALENQVYDGDFTDSDGVTHHAGDPFYSADEINQDSETTYHVVRDSQLAMVKTSTPAYTGGIAPVVKAGDTITYALTLTNSGLATAENVYVCDSIPAGTTYTAGSADQGGVYDTTAKQVNWIIASIPAGGTVTVQFAVTVNTVTAAGLIENAAAYKEVGSTGDPDDPGIPWVPTNPTQHQTISSDKSVSPTGTNFREGQLITYTIMVHVATTDSGVAKGVVVRDTLPAGLSLVAGSIKIRNVQMSDSCYSGGMITWPATDLPAGDTPFTFSAIVNPLAAGVYRASISNAATVNGEPTNMITSTVLSRTSSIAKHARLVVGGVVQSTVQNGTDANPVDVNCGEEIEYTLVVTNTGDAALPSGDIVVSDQLPSYVSLVSSSDSVVKDSGSTATVSAMSYSGGKVLWTVNGMKGNEVLQLKFRVKVQDSVPAGMSVMKIVNQGHLNDKDLEAIVYEATILNPDGTVKFIKYDQVHETSVEQDSNQTFHEVMNTVVTLDKTSTPSGDIREGEVVDYTIHVKVENKPLENWSITDALPSGIGFVSGSLKEASGKLTLSDANYHASTHTILITGTTPLPIGEYTITFKGLALKLATGQTQLQTDNSATIKGDSITDVSDISLNRVVSRYAEISKTAALITLSGSDNPATGGIPALEDNGTASAPVLTELGQVVEYRLQVTNHASGSLTSGAVTVTDQVPNGTTLVPGSISAGGTLRTDGKTITWTLSTLKDGDVKKLSFRVYAPSAANEATGTGVFTNIASMRDAEVEERTYEETVTVITEGGTTTYTDGTTVYTETETTKQSEETFHEVPVSQMEQVKTSDRMNGSDPMNMGKPVKVGDVITYTMTLTNSSAAIAQNVVVRDYIPNGTAYQAGSGMIDGSAYPDSGFFDSARGCVTWRANQIAIGTEMAFSYRVVVTSTKDASGNPITIRNTALYDTDVPPGSTTDPTTPTNPVENPTLTYTKEASPTGNVREGQVITYRVRVTASADMASPVTMRDTLPTGLSLVSGSIKFTSASGVVTTESNSCWNAASRTIVWPGKTLLKGESVYEIRAVVNPAGGSNTSISLQNNAILSDDQGNTWPQVSVTNTLLRRYAAIEKTAALVVKAANGTETLQPWDTGSVANPVDTQAGQTIQYMMTIRNVGQLASGEILVQDVVPAGLSYVNGSMTAVGGKITAANYNATTRTVSWTLNALAANSAQDLFYRATTPLSVGLYENQATLRDTGLSTQTYSENVTTVDGVTHTTTETLYSSADTTVSSNETYHEVLALLQDGQLTVNKVVVDYKGNLITTSRTFVIKVTGPSYPSGTLMELTNSTPLVLKGLIYGQYTVEELNTTNYTVTITAPVTLTGGATSGTITVRNQEKDKSLPVTGESTRGYTIMGVAIMVLGGILLVFSRRRRKTTK